MPKEQYRVSIAQRLLLANAAVIALAVVLLVVTPVTVSAQIKAAEFAVLLVAAAGLLAFNWVLVRRALAPLEQLSGRMAATDLVAGAPSEEFDGPWIREVEAVIKAYSEMVGRLAEERRQTARAVLAGQERERLRVSQELHDEVAQGLVALRLHVDRVSASVPEETAEDLRVIGEHLDFYLDEVRRISHELLPEILEDLGLANALIALANQVRDEADISVRSDLPDRMPALGSETELVVYRVAQESLANIRRHAQASNVDLVLEVKADRLVLQVSDDGKGLAADHSAGLGVKGMRERALLAGGRLELTPASKLGGARVFLELPIETEGSA
jgi:two-component system sensor histidine kinase UhpB